MTLVPIGGIANVSLDFGERGQMSYFTEVNEAAPRMTNALPFVIPQWVISAFPHRIGPGRRGSS